MTRNDRADVLVLLFVAAVMGGVGAAWSSHGNVLVGVAFWMLASAFTFGAGMIVGHKSSKNPA